MHVGGWAICQGSALGDAQFQYFYEVFYIVIVWFMSAL